MERLTEWENGSVTYNEKREIECGEYCDSCSQGAGNCETIKNMIKKLAEYEDLEEQGLLVRLPCKVGTEVFCYFPGDSHYTKCQIKKNRNLSKHIWKYMLLCRVSCTKGTLLQIL